MFSAEFETITPEKAALYLKKNKGNYRAMVSRVVARYANDMATGRWETNGEPIQFDSDGFLVNGQHRLAAIVRAGVPIMMLVVRGVDSSVFDIGRNRSFVQIARANGRVSSTTTAGAIDIIANGFRKHGAMSPTGIYEYYMRHDPDLFDEVTRMTSRGTHGSMIAKKGAIVAALYSAIKLQIITKDSASDFCKVLNTGVAEQGEVGNAAQVLRRQIVSGAQTTPYNASDGNARQNLFEQTWKAIVSYVNGEPRKRDFKPDGTGLDVLAKVREII